MKQKTFNQVSCLIFLLVAVLHVLRLFLGWSANMGGWEIPMWISIFGAIVAAFLAWSAYKMEK